MDSVKESEATKIYFPRELLDNKNKDYSKCVFIGWRSRNKQIFIVNAYSQSENQRLVSVLDSINRASKLMNITYMKNGLEYIDEYRFVRNEDSRNKIKLSLNDTKTGTRLKNIIIFVYNNSSFDFKSTNLFKNLNIQDEVLDEASQLNSSVGACSILCTTLKNYIDKHMENTDIVMNDESDLEHINSFNRKCYYLSLFSHCTYQTFVKITAYISILSLQLLTILNFGSKLVNIMETSSVFVSLLINKVKLISLWHKSYNELLNKKEIVEYIELRSELIDSAVSFYLDFFIGIITVLCFRKLVLNKLFILRSYLKTLYIENLKSLFYISTTKVFIHVKLNNEVSTSLSKFVINKVILWKYVSLYLRPVRVLMFKMVHYASFFGFSSLFAFILDVFKFETTHLYLLYFIMLALMNYCHKYLYSLVQLFKGKKWNILKSELDTNQFTKEHLFIGVVFFTVFTLNYPTIWIFYITIITMLIPVLVTRALTHTLIEVMYEFPYYFFIHNTFGSKKFTKGVYFRHLYESSKDVNEDGEIDYLHLEIVPNKISMTERNSRIKKKVGERLDSIFPIKVIKKILKCKNIFDE